MATSRLAIPTISANQAQKHVTHNEAIKKLDALVQASVKSRTTTAPPGSPAEGDAYLVPASATGAWASEDDNLTVYDGSTWEFFAPGEGWQVIVHDEDLVARYLSGAWGGFSAPSGATVAASANGAASALHVVEEELTGLSGATVDTTIQIPNRAIVFCVSTRTTTAVTGAASYDCGISGQSGKFGGSLGAALNSTNAGVIGPEAFWSDTSVRLTANGSNFSGGAVRVAIHYFLPTVPQS